MTCRNCGAENADGAAFCSSCGRGLLSAAAAEAEPVPAPEPVAAGAGLAWGTEAAAPSPAATPAAPPPKLSAGPATPSHVPGAGEAKTWAEATTLPFRWGDSWYMHRAGVVYRWNGTTSLWDLAPLLTIPEFMRRPRFTSLRGPALVLYSLFGLFIVVSLLAIGADIYHFAKLDEVAGGGFVSIDDRDAAEALYVVTKFFQSLCILAIAPFFIWWTRRATCNVAALGAESPTFSPGWAVGWWFIPFANWVQPLRVLNQAWRAADPAAVAQGGQAWRSARLTPLLPIWWIGYQLVSFGWSIAVGSLDAENQTSEEQANIVAFALVSDIALIVVAGLAVAVVATLTRRQDAANRLVAGQ